MMFETHKVLIKICVYAGWPNILLHEETLKHIWENLLGLAINFTRETSLTGLLVASHLNKIPSSTEATLKGKKFSALDRKG